MNYMKNLTNYDIVPLAMIGGSGRTTTGNMSTMAGYPTYLGYLPHPLQDAFRELRSRITHTIYSYGTPIAVLVDDTWIIPDVTYSNTTGSKHQNKLWELRGERVPWDATAEDIDRVVRGLMRYTGKGWKPGPNWEPGC